MYQYPVNVTYEQAYFISGFVRNTVQSFFPQLTLAFFFAIGLLYIHNMKCELDRIGRTEFILKKVPRVNNEVGLL